MIFEGRPIDKITDDEIDAVVTERFAERQHLEFKATVKYKDSPDRLEILRDIASIANGGGGYLIIGVKDDGKGRAIGYASEIGDIESIKKSVMSLCNDHIVERIYGLEAGSRNIKGNPILIIRVPASERIPHMVTFENKTDFYTRYHDGKREMTIGDIREAFQNDFVSRRLAIIESNIGKIVDNQIIEGERKKALEKIEANIPVQLTELPDSKTISEIALKNFHNSIQKKPYFFIFALPLNPTRKLDLDSNEVQQLLFNPPDARHRGWNVKMDNTKIRRIMNGIQKSIEGLKTLKLLENGYMELSVPLNEYFCWGQNAEEFKKQPLLNAFAVIEYPLSFLKLYKNLIKLFDIHDDILLNFCYINTKGYIIYPTSRDGMQWFDDDLKPTNDENISKTITMPFDYNPDLVNYELIDWLFSAFGLPQHYIYRYYDKENGKFVF